MRSIILIVSQVILYQGIGSKLSQQGTWTMTFTMVVIVRRVTKADGGTRSAIPPIWTACIWEVLMNHMQMALSGVLGEDTTIPSNKLRWKWEGWLSFWLISVLNTKYFMSLHQKSRILCYMHIQRVSNGVCFRKIPDKR